jgi:hypothetical protein
MPEPEPEPYWRVANRDGRIVQAVSDAAECIAIRECPASTSAGGP